MGAPPFFGDGGADVACGAGTAAPHFGGGGEGIRLLLGWGLVLPRREGLRGWFRLVLGM